MIQALPWIILGFATGVFYWVVTKALNERDRYKRQVQDFEDREDFLEAEKDDFDRLHDQGMLEDVTYYHLRYLQARNELTLQDPESSGPFGW